MNRKNTLNKISFFFILILLIQSCSVLNAAAETIKNHAIYNVQKKLTEKGYDPGPIDGIMGIRTSEALKKFQKNNGLSVSGKLDIETEKILLENDKGLADPENDASISSESATTMKHTKPDFFVADQRIRLQAEVENPAGIKLVRCYFKAAGEADLVFVHMTMTGKNEYAGILPAPAPGTSQIEYLFLAVNSANVVVRTQNFYIYKDENKKTPIWQKIHKEGEIKVSMELGKAPTEVAGFSDNVTIDIVESGARFGVVALLYHSISAASVSAATAATGATTAGTITAGTAGWSTATIVGIGVGAAAVVGGTAVAVGDDGGSHDYSGNVAECDTLTTAGEDTPETHSINLGQRSGTFDFSYETYGQEDRMIVTYEGNVLFDTDCVGTNGTWTQSISYSGKSFTVTVEVIPNCFGGSGTEWNFTVNCPR